MGCWPTWTEWRTWREEKAQKPDYSFDRWVRQAKEFGDDVNKIRAKAEDEGGKLDRRKKDAEAKADAEDRKASDKPEPDDDPEGKEGLWKRLRQIHRDRLAKDGKDDHSSERSAVPAGPSR